MLAKQPSGQVEYLNTFVCVGLVPRAGDDHFGVGIPDCKKRSKLALERRACAYVVARLDVDKLRFTTAAYAGDHLDVPCAFDRVETVHV